ncbi:MAG: hypothetical protein ACOWYE_02175 [Desulfatiglandales bacterium]
MMKGVSKSGDEYLLVALTAGRFFLAADGVLPLVTSEREHDFYTVIGKG